MNENRPDNNIASAAVGVGADAMNAVAQAIAAAVFGPNDSNVFARQTTPEQVLAEQAAVWGLRTAIADISGAARIAIEIVIAEVRTDG